MASRFDSRWLRAALVLAVLALLTSAGIRAWRGHLDEVAAERYASKLETLRMLHARLSAEILKTRTGLVPHYDGLVRHERALDALYAALRRTPEFLTTSERADLLAELDASERDSEATFALVERFKSENAVLRNSLLFLRTAASALDAYPGDTPEKLAFRERASALVRDVLLIRLFQDARVLERVSRELRALSEYVESLPSERRGELRLVLHHAGLAREHVPGVDALLRELVDHPEPMHVRQLVSSYARFHRAALSAAGTSTAVLLTLLLVSGMAMAAAVIVRMRRSTRDLQRTGRKLRAALDALHEEQAKQRELSELKARFIAMTSHEFRTPLSAIMSSSEMLSAYDDRWSKEKKAQHFERIRGAVLHMTRMLEGVLLIGKSDAGELTYRPGIVHVVELCNETVEVATKALGPGHELAVTAPLDAAEVVMADAGLLRHVLDNLLSNAIKYSPKGGRIELAVAREGEELIFDVRDQGIGIPARDCERLFDVFHRGSNVGSLPGSGLGLSIVKRAVDLHGGRIEIQSEVGVGTRFLVRVPCPRSAA